MAYNTGNPLGSKDPRDLYDNATSFDLYVNGPDPMYADRFGEQKLSIEGQQQAFESAQTGRDEQFQQALASIGLSPLGEYAAGITFTTRQQYITRADLAYKIATSTPLPFTLTGNWAADETKLEMVNSDQILRSDLAAADGATLVHRADSNVDADLTELEGRATAAENSITSVQAEQAEQSTQIANLSETISKAGIYPGQRFATYNGGGQLAKFQRMLVDPFTQMLGVCVLADSIGWGMITSGMGAIEPRAGALTDARNNGVSPSWVNLLHKWLGNEFYANSPVVEAIWPGTPSGVAQFTYTAPVDMFPGFAPFTQIGSMSQLLASDSTLGVLWFVNMSSSGGGPHSFSWTMTGDSFDLRYGATPEGAQYRVYVDGVLLGTYATSSSDQGIPIGFKNSRTHSFAFKRGAVIKVEAVGGNVSRDTLRVESIRFNRKLRVTNQGIVGVASERYRTVLLSSAMRADDSVALIQLGTNDRGMPAAIDAPTSPASLSRNLSLMLDTIIAAGATPILFCANQTDDNAGKAYSMGEVRASIANLAGSRVIDFVDQFGLTARLKAAGINYLADGLHPNDLGHFLMFDNIRNVLSSPSA